MLVRMMVPTESEPAITFEKVQPGTTLCELSVSCFVIHTGNICVPRG